MSRRISPSGRHEEESKERNLSSRINPFTTFNFVKKSACDLPSLFSSSTGRKSF